MPKRKRQTKPKPRTKKKKTVIRQDGPVPPGYHHAVDVARHWRMIRMLKEMNEERKEAEEMNEAWMKRIEEEVYVKETGRMRLLPPLDENGDPLISSEAMAILIRATYYDGEPEGRANGSLRRRPNLPVLSQPSNTTTTSPATLRHSGYMQAQAQHIAYHHGTTQQNLGLRRGAGGGSN